MPMDKHEYHIEGRITPAVFRSFSIYDVLVRRRRWKGPALFALIMCAFAVVCYLMRSIRGPSPEHLLACWKRLECL